MEHLKEPAVILGLADAAAIAGVYFLLNGRISELSGMVASSSKMIGESRIALQGLPQQTSRIENLELENRRLRESVETLSKALREQKKQMKSLLSAVKDSGISIKNGKKKAASDSSSDEEGDADADPDVELALEELGSKKRRGKKGL